MRCLKTNWEQSSQLKSCGPVNLRQNGWLNTRLLMRQKGKQETSGAGKPGALEATYHSVNRNRLHSLEDLREGLATIILRRLYNTDEVGKSGLQLWLCTNQLCSLCLKITSKAGKTFSLCIFWITWNNKWSVQGKCWTEWKDHLASEFSGPQLPL